MNAVKTQEEIPGILESYQTEERRVMAYVLDNPDWAREQSLVAEDLESEHHRLILEIVTSLHDRGLAADATAVIHHFDEQQPDGWVPARQVVIHLLEVIDVPWGIWAVNLLRSLRVRRAQRAVHLELVTAGRELREPYTDPRTVALAAGTALAAAAARAPGEVTSVRDLVAGLRCASDLLQTDTPNLIATGIPELDRDLGGLALEGVTLVIGSSGMGKTSVVNRLVVGLCRQGLAVYLHGSETSEHRRVDEISMTLARLPARTERLTDPASATDQLERARAEVASWRLHVTGSGLTISEIEVKARDLYRRGECDVVIVDYVQDVPLDKAVKVLGTTDKVMACSQALKDLAADLEIPVVVAAQAKPKTLDEAKRNPRHGMWDAQWASKLAQDAEEVWVLYRDDVYALEWGEAWASKGRPGELEVWRRKSRKQGAGVARMPFDGPTKWIGEALPEYRPPATWGM